MKKDNLAMQVWDVLYPLLFYYSVIVLVMFVTQLLLGADSKNYMTRQIIASLIAIPLVYQLFYKVDILLVNEAKIAWRQKGKMKLIGGIVLTSAFLGIGLNNVISMSPLISMSQAFTEANEGFYGSTIGLELLGSAFLTPILEELVYRGVIFTRIRRKQGLWAGVFLSAFIFGLMHFNVVQFVYAFLLGVVLAIFMDRCGNLFGPVIGHIVVNLISVIRTETGLLDWSVDKSLLAWITSIGFLLAGNFVFYFMIWKLKKE